MSLIFGKETGDCTGYWVGQRRPDNFYQQKRGIRKTLSGNKSDSNTNSTYVHRQLTTEDPSFLGLPSARLLDCQTGQTALWVFLLGFSYSRSRTGLCTQIRILLFSHHGSLFHTTTLYLPHLFWHVSRIRNHLRIVKLKKPIGWCYDGDPNINSKCRNLTQQVVHLTQNVALMQANQNFPPPAPIPQPSPTFTPISTTTTTISARTGPEPGGIHAFLFTHQRMKDCNSPPLFWKKGWHWIFHKWILLIYEWSKIGIHGWRCQNLLDPFVHAD